MRHAILGIIGVLLTGSTLYAAKTVLMPTDPFTVSLVQTSSSTDRSQCLRFSLVPSVSTACGVLEVAHPLPAVHSNDRDYAPVLVYHSDQNYGVTGTSQDSIFIPIDVKLNSGGPTPTIVRTTLSQNFGGGYWFDWVQRVDTGAYWATNSAYRLQSGMIDLYAPTSAWTEIRAKVEYWNGSSWIFGGVSPSVTRPTVNEPIARGWSIAGMERLLLAGYYSQTAIIKVSSDGSARRYLSTGRTTASGQEVFAPASDDLLDRPDSILKNTATDSTFVRNLTGGARIEYDFSGKHVRTITRTGDTTTFAYGTSSPLLGLLTSITLPHSINNLVYSFHYGQVTDPYGNSPTYALDSIVSPGAGGNPRVTRLSYSNRYQRIIDQIADADSQVVSFAYNASGRMSSRTDRRGTVTLFNYAGNNTIVSRAATIIATGDTVFHNFQNSEARGSLGSAPVVLSRAVVTLYDGPLSNGDTTTFWVNRRGAVDSVMNANGQKVKLTRDATYPARITQTISPNGFTTGATYDSRGNVATTTASAPYGGSNATTTYTWDQKWDVITKVKRPAGDSSVSAVDSTNGNILWAQDGANASRVYFTYKPDAVYSYETCSRRLTSSTDPDFAGYDTYGYDQFCNTNRIATRTGNVTKTFVDRIGRDSVTLDSLSGVSTTIRYTTIGRIFETTRRGPSRSYTLGGTNRFAAGDTLLIRNTYDEEGNLVAVLRNAGKTASTNQGNVTTTFSFDRLNRKTGETVPGSGLTSYRYDKSGNTLRRVSSFGDSITMEYNALGQLIRRVEPARTYTATSCTGIDLLETNPSCPYTLPRAEDPLVSGGSRVVQADTAVFSYDVSGNMIRADNKFARIRRSYYANGQLRHDTSMVVVVNPANSGSTETIDGLASPGKTSDFTSHQYITESTYDLNGRRIRLKYPSQFATCGSSCVGRDTLSFDGNGQLQKITNGSAMDFTFAYTAGGLVDSTLYGNGIREKLQYNNDGRVSSRRLRFPAGAPNGLASLAFMSDSFEYDKASRLTLARGVKARRDTMDASLTTTFTENAYSSLGALVDSYSWDVHGFAANAVNDESYQTDAIGQRFFAQERLPGYETNVQYTTMDTLGRVLTVRDTSTRVYSPPQRQRLDHQYFADGSIRFSVVRHLADYRSDSMYYQDAMYYGSNGKLRYFERHGGKLAASDDANSSMRGLLEEYRYDALGRRVSVRSLRNSACTTTGCASTIQRFVWDGQQLLAETRGRGGISETNTVLENDAPGGADPYGNVYQFGAVVYTHASGIDHPIGLIRLDSITPTTLIPHLNGRGQYEVTSNANGDLMPCVGSGCVPLTLPSADRTYFKIYNMTQFGPPTTPVGWAGSLLNDQIGETGLAFRRNRFYDGRTGRFTQTDPIGMSGGLNVYGYAGGDPVNFGDPLGLVKTEQTGYQRPGFNDGTDGDYEAGFSAAGPGLPIAIIRRLNSGEIEQMGVLCQVIDCTKIVLRIAPKDNEAGCWGQPGFTMGHNVCVQESEYTRQGKSLLCHEVSHVVQYEAIGARRYIARGINDHVIRKYILRKHPYDYPATDQGGLEGYARYMGDNC